MRMRSVEKPANQISLRCYPLSFPKVERGNLGVPQGSVKAGLAATNRPGTCSLRAEPIESQTWSPTRGKRLSDNFDAQSPGRTDACAVDEWITKVDGRALSKLGRNRLKDGLSAERITAGSRETRPLPHLVRRLSLGLKGFSDSWPMPL